LLISFVKSVIYDSSGAYREESSEGKSELDKVSGLETTPDEDGSKGNRICKSSHKTIGRQRTGTFLGIHLGVEVVPKRIGW
jgi:hypothetical protein